MFELWQNERMLTAIDYSEVTYVIGRLGMIFGLYGFLTLSLLVNWHQLKHHFDIFYLKYCHTLYLGC